jgi:hypothetical protein
MKLGAKLIGGFKSCFFFGKKFLSCCEPFRLGNDLYCLAVIQNVVLKWNYLTLPGIVVDLFVRLLSFVEWCSGSFQ